MDMETKSMRQFILALRKAVDRRLFVIPKQMNMNNIVDYAQQ